MISIFNFFKRRSENQDDPENTITSPQPEAREVLESARGAFVKIQSKMFEIKDQKLFTDLIAFVAYYSAIIQCYFKDMEAIISVNELLLFKYIDMVDDILTGFDERLASREQKEEFSNTLHTINEKLYHTLQNIKEQQSMDLNIDLKTIRDLIKSDF